jgi:DNA-binding PadR family transcriptional regulator
MHGYSIIQEIEGRTEGELEIGTSTLYAAIQRLVKAGVLEETERPAGIETEHSRRRYYRATAFGREVARLEADRIRRLERRMAKARIFELLADPGAAK